MPHRPRYGFRVASVKFPQAFPAVITRVCLSLQRFIGAAAAVFLVLLAAPSCEATSSNQFLRLTSYATGGTPTRMVSADFNRDGKADLVVLNSNGVLSFVAGTGAGGFHAPAKIATVPSSSANALMAVGDFNGDGNEDVALLAPPGNAVKVFLGHGNGTFAAAVTISDGLPSAGTMTGGDFNNDGKTDLAIAGVTSVSILFGNGNGVFGKPQVTATGLSASAGSLAMALGDLNGDSHLDIAVTDGNGNLQTLLGSATGALHPQTGWTFYGMPINTLAIADFNGDGKLDIAVGAGSGLPQYVYPFACFFDGNGDGTFTGPQDCLDIRLDSFSEMLVTNLNRKPGLTFSTDPLMVFDNDGTGVFSQTNYSAGGPLALADFNGDGMQDIASGSSSGVQVLLNAGGGIVRAPLALVQTIGTFTFTLGMNTTDMNRDGYADLVLDEFWDEHGTLLPSVGVLLGGRRNTFTPSANMGQGYYALGGANVLPPAIGDFNNDGLLDVAYSAYFYSANDNENETYDRILFGDGKGGLVSAGPVLSFATDYFAAGYFNAGGTADLASVDSTGLGILIGKGDGTFAPPVNYGVGENPAFVLQRDLSGDGKTDLVVVNHDSDTVSILLGNGNGTFKPQKTYAVGKLPNVAVTGDFNRDGKIDIAVGTSEGISVLLGNGNGTFKAQKLYSDTGPITGIAQAILRQDGIGSLLGVDSATSRFVLLPGVGDGTFGKPVFYPVDHVPVGILAGDVDGDGAPDIALLIAHQGEDGFTGQPIGGNLAVYYNQGGDHVSMSSSSNHPKAKQEVTLSARVVPSLFEPAVATGKITFKDGTHTLGVVTLTKGGANLNVEFAAGTHSVVADYGGDSNYNPNHSATVTIVVAH